MPDPYDKISDAEKEQEKTPSSNVSGSATRERDFLSREGDINTILVRIGKQTIWLRAWVSVLALSVMAAFGVLEYMILDYITSSYVEPGELFFLFAISPIAAITAIVVSLLFGVFRGYRGNELDGMGNAIGKITAGTNN